MEFMFHKFMFLVVSVSLLCSGKATYNCYLIGGNLFRKLCFNTRDLNHKSNSLESLHNIGENVIRINQYGVFSIEELNDSVIKSCLIGSSFGSIEKCLLIVFGNGNRFHRALILVRF